MIKVDDFELMQTIYDCLDHDDDLKNFIVTRGHTGEQGGNCVLLFDAKDPTATPPWCITVKPADQFKNYMKKEKHASRKADSRKAR
jgi:hypothetical protein